MDLRLDPDLIHRWVMIRRSSTVWIGVQTGASTRNDSSC
jgi:hypothetical protein